MSSTRLREFISPWILNRPVLAAAAVVALVGCGRQAARIDPELLASYQQRFLLAEEPAGAQAVLDLRESFIGPVEDPHDDSQLGEAEHSEVDPDAGDVVKFAADDVSEEISPSLEPRDVVMVGQIGGMPNPWCDTEPDFPWKEGMATMFVVDPGTAAEFAASGHAHEDSCDCPFCSRHAAENVNSIAIVHFLDERGELIDISADKLLGVKQDETVVVRGLARIVAGELLEIHADGVYVRR